MITIKDIENIKIYISYILSPLNVNKATKEDVKKLEKINEQVNDYLINNPEVNNNNDLKPLLKELNDYLAFKKLVPSTSAETLQTINNKLNDLGREIQVKSSYSPKLYFNTYFLQNGISQKDEVNITNALKANTSSEAFKSWFVGSKVVDDKNNPLLVYHGRYNEEVTKFSFDTFPARYFAENKSYAEYFKNLKPNGTLYTCYLKILYPLDFTNFSVNKVKYEDFKMYCKLKYSFDFPESIALKAMSDRDNGCWIWQYFRFGVDWIKFIIKDGRFDGIYFIENNPQDILSTGEENTTFAWMVFKPEQIKSSYTNTLFDYNSNDIRFEKGGNFNKANTYSKYK